MKWIAAPLLAVSLLPQVSGPPPKTLPLTETIKKLESRVESLESSLKFANQRIWALEKLTSESVALDASHLKGYSQLATTSGHFVLSLRNAEPYLDGYRVSVEVGNITTARYNGFKLIATWAGESPDWKVGAEKLKAYFAKRERQTGEFSFTEELAPGTWTQVELTLTPATPEDVKGIDLKMETNLLSLIRPTSH